MTDVSSMPRGATDSMHFREKTSGSPGFGTIPRHSDDENNSNMHAKCMSYENGYTRETKTNQNRGQTRNVVANGDITTPRSKSQSRVPAHRTPLSLPTNSPLKSPGTPKARSLPRTPENPTPPTPTNKKLPMNKIQVGAAPSPNLRAAKSKVGSLINTTHKPGGGNIRIESHKIDFSKTQSRIEAKNDQYVRSGGDKKIPQVKLQWEAKSKIGSLENSTYKPGGGDKKIESVKLDFKERAKSKVGSKDNVKHVPGGGTVKIESQKLEFKAQSKVGSLDNVKHKPGGGDVKIFDDKTYLKQISTNSSEGGVSGSQSHGYLSAVRGVGRRSAPGTPGPKTRIKIMKTTILSHDPIPVLHTDTESDMYNPLQSSGSSNLLEDKSIPMNNTDMYKFIKDEMAEHENVQIIAGERISQNRNKCEMEATPQQNNMPPNINKNEFSSQKQSSLQERAMKDIKVNSNGTQNSNISTKSEVEHTSQQNNQFNAHYNAKGSINNQIQQQTYSDPLLLQQQFRNQMSNPQYQRMPLNSQNQ